MLRKIKSIKGIKYYHVVPVDHLTGRLAAEARINPIGPVAVALTGLLVNSFCPHGSNARSKDQIHRMIKLVTDQPVAASVFYRNLSRHVPMVVVENLVANLFRCVHFAIQEVKCEVGLATTDRRERSRDHDEDTVTVCDSTQATESPEVNATDIILLTSLIETASTLCSSTGRKSNRPTSESNGETRLQTLDGQVLLDLLLFFEESSGSDIIDSDEGNHDDFDGARARAVAALLACVEYFPSHSAQDAIRHAKKVLSSLSDETPSWMDVTPYVSLLCSLRLTEDVASSLAASVESSFDVDFTLRFASPEAGTRKRKSGEKRKTLVVPMLPPRIALKVLSDIMKGVDTRFESARKYLFSSGEACEIIEGALARGTKLAERILQGNESKVRQSCHPLMFIHLGWISFSSLSFQRVVASEPEVEFILDVCEAYGRFTLHKEASAKPEGQLSGNEVKRLVDWASATIIPLIATRNTESENVPFNDPDLSRISIEKSFDGRVSSPMPSGPPRQRQNRNRTPVRLDLNESLLGSLTKTSQSLAQRSRDARDVAISLLQSCLVLLSERVCAGSANVSTIVETTMKWMTAFETEDRRLHLDHLLSTFFKLSFSLCKHASEFELLKYLLVKCSEFDDDQSPVAAIVSNLVAYRSLTAGIVNCVLEAAQLLLYGEETANLELPDSLDDLFDGGKSCVRSAMKAICSTKAGYHELAKRIVGAFDKQELEGAYEIFCAKCLFVLCDANSSKFAPEARNMARGLAVEATDEPEGVKALLGAIFTLDAE
jgi:hypothetical protein